MSYTYFHFHKYPFNRQYSTVCPEYNPFHCSRHDRSPGAGNGCSNWSYCIFDKYQYYPEDAHIDYRTTLIDSKEGVTLTSQESNFIEELRQKYINNTLESMTPNLVKNITNSDLLDIHYFLTEDDNLDNEFDEGFYIF